MLGQIKKNSILKNFSSLSILQFSNYIFPLITFPYLVRVIGPDKFGLVNFASSFISYFIILTDYGFNLSAVREISVNRNNSRINLIFNSVLSVKILLFCISLLLVIAAIVIVPQFRENYTVYIISFAYVVGVVLFPVWFFQGMEQMKYITIINVVVKILTTLLIFILITNSSDFLTLILINSSASIVIGLVGLLTAIKKFNLVIFLPSLEDIKNQLTESWYEFISIISISFYTISSTFILGLIAGTTSVGFFSGADKIRSAIQSIFTVLLQAVYPHVSFLFSRSREEGLRFVQKLLRIILIPSFIFSLLMVLFADQIIIIILGKQYINSILPLKILAILPVAINISNVFGVQVMLNLGYKIAFLKIVSIFGFINLIISFILVPKYSELGTAISMAIVEIMVTLSMFIFLKRQGINFFK